MFAVEEAALLSADGLGILRARCGRRVRVADECARNDRISAFAGALLQRDYAIPGFLKFGDEYKVMGLGAYGEPEFLDKFREIVRSNGSGFRLALKYFTHHRTGPEMSWAEADKTPVLANCFLRMPKHLGPARNPEEAIEQRHKNLAASLQARLEEVYLGMLRNLAAEAQLKSVCLAEGGVQLRRERKDLDATPFENVYVHPAREMLDWPLARRFMCGSGAGEAAIVCDGACVLGAGFSVAEDRQAIEAARLTQGGYAIAEMEEEKLLERTAKIIGEGKIPGWFQGRAEWGPRALGNRSIVADPRRPEMKEILNRRIKHREIFRPFAPSILAEATGAWFEKSHPSPFMTMAYSVRREKAGEDSCVDACRWHGTFATVTKTANPRYWKLIKEVERQTGVPVVLNTRLTITSRSCANHRRRLIVFCARKWMRWYSGIF